MKCPLCGAALVLGLHPADEDTEAVERRDAWEAAEDAALLREAQNGGLER